MDDNSALIQAAAWYLKGDKLLPGPVMTFPMTGMCHQAWGGQKIIEIYGLPWSTWPVQKGCNYIPDALMMKFSLP